MQKGGRMFDFIYYASIYIGIELVMILLLKNKKGRSILSFLLLCFIIFIWLF